MIEKVLVIGATGTLARPVVRRMISAGLSVRAFVRNVSKGEALLPDEAELFEGRLEDIDSIARGLHGMDAVYMNLASPYDPETPFDPMRDGTANVIAAAKAGSVTRVATITSAGVGDKAIADWWPVGRKMHAEKIMRESGLPYTIFRPDWFCESLAMFNRDGTVVCPKLGDAKLRWLAGDDYGRQVTAALQSVAAKNKVYVCRGPEALTIEEAMKRFIQAHDPNLKLQKAPLWVMGLAGMFSPKMLFMHGLMKFTKNHMAGDDGQEAWEELYRPEMTIEDYVAYMHETGDVPSA